MRPTLTVDDLTDLFCAQTEIEVYGDYDAFQNREDMMFLLCSDFHAAVYLKPKYAQAKVNLIDVVSQDRLKCMIIIEEEQEESK